MNYRAISLLSITTLVLILGYSYLNSQPNKSNQDTNHLNLLTVDGEPSAPLLELLDLVGAKHQNTLSSIVEVTQAEWLRIPGSERWHMSEIYADMRDQILYLATEIGCITEQKPTAEHYQYALVFGATVQAFRSRFAYLIELYNQGIRFDNIIILVGARPLDPAVESPNDITSNTSDMFPFKQDWQLNGALPTTETEMARVVVDQAVLPAGFEKITITFVDTPMQPTSDGKIRRPNTADTISLWLSTNPTPGPCLLISSQPYVGCQHATACTYFPATFSIETVGYKARDTIKNAVLLDTLARWLYQELKLKEKRAAQQH